MATHTGKPPSRAGITQRQGFFEPYNIRGQMLFQNFVMLKMFLSAIVASIVWFSILSLLPFTASKFQSARNNLGCRMNSKGMAAAAIGGAMLGIGMALSGACPGAVLIEVGAGVQHAGMTFIGCLVGAVLYGITEESVNNMIRPSEQITVKKLDEHVGVPYIIFALPVALVIMLALVLIEYMAPWQTELTSPNASDVLTGLIDFISLRSWPPVLAGMLVGCLQLPIVLAVDEPIGGSRGYCTLVSQVIPMSFLEKFSPYLKASRTGLKNWWQVLYITSAIGGAAASALSSGTWSSTVGVPPLHALLGGVVMIYGSRLAGGCTSGHGLSGIGSLSILSFIAIPAMFAGGIATAVTMTTLGIY
ncbi:thiosulfate transporter TsuA-like [Lytechinus pictus]|uniref:thiosulfate transporter TsuA-like n=1 Tax=Lytechinus pictus TaxID=7653 RepID=UPI0030BA0521